MKKITHSCKNHKLLSLYCNMMSERKPSLFEKIIAFIKPNKTAKFLKSLEN